MELGGHALQIENLESACSVVTDMNRKAVKSKHAEGVTFDTHVIANPTNPKCSGLQSKTSVLAIIEILGSD